MLGHTRKSGTTIRCRIGIDLIFFHRSVKKHYSNKLWERYEK